MRRMFNALYHIVFTVFFAFAGLHSYSTVAWGADQTCSPNYFISSSGECKPCPKGSDWVSTSDGTTEYCICPDGYLDPTTRGQWIYEGETCAINDYSIFYHLGVGATNYPGAPDTYTVKDTITLGTPTLSGATFQGWYTDPYFKNKITKIEKGSFGTIYLWAKWSNGNPGLYEVTFNCNGGTFQDGAMQKTRLYVGDYVILSLICQKENQIVTGWKVSGTSDVLPTKVVEWTYNSAKTLTAQWQACTPCNPDDSATCSISTITDECIYHTFCKTGYENIVNDRTPNPSCSPKSIDVVYRCLTPYEEGNYDYIDVHTGDTVLYGDEYTIREDVDISECKLPGTKPTGYWIYDTSEDKKILSGETLTWDHTYALRLYLDTEYCKEAQTEPGTCNCPADKYPTGHGCTSCVRSCSFLSSYPLGEYNVCESQTSSLCYRECTTDDIKNSTGVSGTITNGGVNTCKATACLEGYRVSDDGTACELGTYEVTYSCGTGTGVPPAADTVVYTKEYTTKENTCTKEGLYVFVGWKVSDTEDILPASEKIHWNYLGSKELVAEWKLCEACNPTNATCELSVVDNTCTYVTECLPGYDNIQNNGWHNPICTGKVQDVEYSCKIYDGLPLIIKKDSITYNTEYTIPDIDISMCREPGGKLTNKWTNDMLEPKVVSAGDKIKWLQDYTLKLKAHSEPCERDPNKPGTCDCEESQFPDGSGSCEECVKTCDLLDYSLGEYNVCLSQTDDLCYRQCTTDDIEHSTSVSGTVTKDGINTCIATECQEGYRVSDDGTACEISNFTVTFDKQGGTGGDDSVNVTYEKPMPNVTPPTKADNSFNGYFDSLENGKQYYDAKGNSLSSWDKKADATLYAQWTQCQPCEPTNATCSVSSVDNECVYETACLPGYGNIQNNGKYNPSCSANVYNATYSCGTGSGSAPAADTATYNESYTVKNIGSCTKPGYEFNNWDDGADGVAPGEITWLYTDDTTFTALWNACESNTNASGTCGCESDQYPNGSGCSNCSVSCSGDLTFNLGEYNVCLSQTDDICYRQCTTSDVANSTEVSGTVTKGGENTCSASSCEADYYLENKACVECPENAVCDGGSNPFECNPGYHKTEDGKGCEPDEYDITLNKNGGTGTINGSTGTMDATQVCKHGEPCSLPSSGLERTGWAFTGWGDSSSCTSGKYQMTFTTEKTIYACWSQQTTECEVGQQYNGSTHETCESGYYCTGEGLVSIGVAGCSTECPVGADGSTPGSSAATGCYKNCPEKTITGGTITTIEDQVFYDGMKYPTCTYKVTCNEGYIAENQNTANANCRLCEPGDYCPGGEGTDPLKCPDGGTSAAGATSDKECYKTCPEPSVIENGTLTNVQDQVYYNGSTYPACTYTATCDEGYVAQNSPGTNPTCVINDNDCPAGYYCEDGEKHPCPEGGTSLPGSTSITQCFMNCPDGKPIENGSMTSVEDKVYHNGTKYPECTYVITCNDGYSQVDDECIECPEDNVCTDGQQKTCAELTGNTHPHSDAGTTDKNMCYTDCPLAENAMSMTGRDYYGAPDTCKVERCLPGFYPDKGACVVCPEGWICDGTDPEKKSCADLGDGSWKYSEPGAKEDSDCYRICESYPLIGGTAIPINEKEYWPDECKFRGETDDGEPCEIIDDKCVISGCKYNQEMINGECQPCNREHALAYVPGFNCVVASCEMGWHPKGQRCEEDVKECRMPNAVYSEQRWDSSRNAFGECIIKECEPDFHIVANACVRDTRPCEVENGAGVQYWNDRTNSWGDCEEIVCNPGYTSDAFDSAEPTKQCGRCKNMYSVLGEVAVSGYVQECEIASCLYQGELYNLDNNECVPICDINGYEDETGTMKWDPSRKKCVRTCKEGYSMW